MNFALVPWTDDDLKDGIFNLENSRGRVAPLRMATIRMKEEFERLGHSLHTYDCYNDWAGVDYFLYWTIEWIAAEKIIKAGYGEKIIYCNAEPPTVCELHTEQGYEILKQIFPCILTWNPEWTDGKQIFKRCIPYFYNYSPSTVPFAKRKLVTGISANKHSDYTEELYTERENIYSYFESKYPNQFDFYGTYWDGTNHPCYRGTVDDKAEVFHKYKFAICFENTRTRKDYITEKIWDCLTSQIVPIYLGAENIHEYVPEKCFIDFNDFESYDALAKFLLEMNEIQYQGYLDRAKEFLQSSVIQKFSGEQYAHDIIFAAGNMKSFAMTEYGQKFLLSKVRKEKWNLCKMKLRRQFKKLLRGI